MVQMQEHMSEGKREEDTAMDDGAGAIAGSC